MKYIDSEKLIAYIERRKEKYRNTFLIQNPIKMEELNDLLDVIGSLQQDHLPDAGKMVEQDHIADVSNMVEQQEVDLEKEIEKTIRSVFFDLGGIAIMGTSAYANVEDMEYIARYFYELGVKAGKEK